MISEQHFNIKSKKCFCKTPELIENYEQAIADTTQIWHCHHRDEIKVLPSGMIAIRSKHELIENGRYYDCPPNELIFLTQTEHIKLHNENRKTETNQKIRESKIGNTFGKYHKDKPKSEFGIIYFNHYGYCFLENKKQYKDSYNYWKRNNKKLLWEQ